MRQCLLTRMYALKLTLSVLPHFGPKGADKFAIRFLFSYHQIWSKRSKNLIYTQSFNFIPITERSHCRFKMLGEVNLYIAVLSWTEAAVNGSSCPITQCSSIRTHMQLVFYNFKSPFSFFGFCLLPVALLSQRKKKSCGTQLLRGLLITTIG